MSSDKPEDAGNDPADAAQRMHAELDETDDLQGKSLYRSAIRICHAVLRQARAERKLIPFVRANFGILNFAEQTLELEEGKQAALEIIAMLEDPARLMAFEPDYSQ